VLDNDGGIRCAVAHLLERGHRRIALVGDLVRLATHRERVAAFEAAMTAAGVTDWRRYVRADCHDAATAEHAVREVLAVELPPTALITTNNLITTGALRALRDRPDRPALVGFDDFDLADVLGVTVISHDPERMGELGAEQILTRLAGTDGPARRMLLATELVERASVDIRRT
jgi:LacI family transcriptional regulator